MLERVSGIVSRTEARDVEPAQDAVCAERRIGQARDRALPDRRRRLLVQQIVDAEVANELEMRPVIERIAQRRRYGARPGDEFLVRARIAGAVAFGYAVGAHRAPLVVVAFEPDLEEGSE